jgi:N-methylhydantoinase A
LEERGRAEFAAEGLAGVPQRSIDVRYRGQGYELNVVWDDSDAECSLDAFHALHQQNYGFCDGARAVEIVNLRLRMTAKGEAYEPVQQEAVPGDGRVALCGEREVFFSDRWICSRVYKRDGLVAGDEIHGPALITEYTSATLLWPGDVARVDGFANLIISVASGEDA